MSYQHPIQRRRTFLAEQQARSEEALRRHNFYFVLFVLALTATMWVAGTQQ